MELVAKDTEIRKLPERFINCYLPVSFKLTKYFRNTVDTYRILKTCTDFFFFLTELFHLNFQNFYSSFSGKIRLVE